MRYRDALLLVVLMLVAAGPLLGQAEKAAPAPDAAEARAAEVQATLAKTTFLAKRAIPASENIFVEDGKIVESLFAQTRQENDTALAAGKPATVSKVLLLDKAVHVFFDNDKFALLILTKEDQKIADMTPAQLVELARKGIAALFNVKEAPKPVT